MEEEKVKVTYNGRMYDASKYGSGYSLYIDGGYITNSSDGWRFSFSDSEHPDYFFWIKYRKDGYMEYANDMMKRPGFSDGVYKPDTYCMGTIEDSARTLYYVSKQLEAHEKMGVSPVEVLELRYRMLGMTLKMLGYESVSQVLHGEPNPDISVVDLNRAVEFIEKYPAFAQYVTKGGYSSSPTVEVSIPADFDKEKFKEEFVEAKRMLEEEERAFDSRTEFFTNIRHPMIKSDFGLGMKEKMPSYDWKTYSETVKKLGKLVLGFNADLLAPAEKMKIVQATSLKKMDMERQTFLITQVPEMDEALAAESYYFIEEVESLDRKMQEDLQDERTRNSTPGKVMQQFVNELQVEVDDRRKGIERRDYYRNVYPYEKDPKERQKALEKFYGIKIPESQDDGGTEKENDSKEREQGE